MFRRWLFGAFLLAIAACADDNVKMQNSALVKTQAKISKQFEDIHHIERQTASHLGDETVFFDVREPDEFHVSHLQNAIRVDPDLSGEEFLKRYGDQIEGKDLLFYCSVGMRSSAMAARVQSSWQDAGSRQIYNLEGGIFGWHNDQRTLFDAAGKTDYVHPFNAYWGRMINDQNLVRYEADNEP